MRRYIRATKEIEPVAEHREGPSCRHHWIIEIPSGLRSRGHCRLCGEERQFQNYIEDHYWEWGPITDGDMPLFSPSRSEPETD